MGDMRLPRASPNRNESHQAMRSSWPVSPGYKICLILLVYRLLLPWGHLVYIFYLLTDHCFSAFYWVLLNNLPFILSYSKTLHTWVSVLSVSSLFLTSFYVLVSIHTNTHAKTLTMANKVGVCTNTVNTAKCSTFLLVMATGQSKDPAQPHCAGVFHLNPVAEEVLSSLIWPLIHYQKSQKHICFTKINACRPDCTWRAYVVQAPAVWCIELQLHIVEYNGT